MGHILWFTGVGGPPYLPLSMARPCALIRSLVIAFRVLLMPGGPLDESLI